MNRRSGFVVARRVLAGMLTPQGFTRSESGVSAVVGGLRDSNDTAFQDDPAGTHRTSVSLRRRSRSKRSSELNKISAAHPTAAAASGHCLPGSTRHWSACTRRRRQPRRVRGRSLFRVLAAGRLAPERSRSRKPSEVCDRAAQSSLSSIATTSNSTVPLGVSAAAFSPTFLPSRACATGLLVRIFIGSQS